MRASRLLRLLLLLQNRGRMSCNALAAELEVARRTVLRDLDALTEAGLPVVVSRGARGGVELGFNYRSRLTGLSTLEAEALGVLLSTKPALLEAVGLSAAARAASTKLLESLPDGVREKATAAGARFRAAPEHPPPFDERVAPLAKAIRERRRVRVKGRGKHPRTVHPVALVYGGAEGWLLEDALKPESPVHLSQTGAINISALRF